VAASDSIDERLAGAASQMGNNVSRERVISFPRFAPDGIATGARAVTAADNYAQPLLLCVAVLTIFRIMALILSGTELFFDEAQYWFWSRELAFGYYSKPPLIAWIIRGVSELCGQGEACIRAPSPLIHAATAMVVYAIGRRLYDGRIGFWAGIAYATLPGVSFSSGLISTDVPLLFFVALALLALIRLKEGGGWDWALVLGAAIGFGLAAKLRGAADDPGDQRRLGVIAECQLARPEPILRLVEEQLRSRENQSHNPENCQHRDAEQQRRGVIIRNRDRPRASRDSARRESRE
jgi:hypothetical protein